MKYPFYWLAVGVGLVIMLLLLQSGVLGPEESMRLPLLTLLIVNEFGFFVTLIGVVFAGRDIQRVGFTIPRLLMAVGNGVLAVAFVFIGMKLWPGLAG